MANHKQPTSLDYSLEPKTSIRIVPGLCGAALNKDLHKEVSLWYCLHAINLSGSGRLQRLFAIEQLKQYFNYPRSTSYRLLRSGDGIFWDLSPAKGTSDATIKIRGLFRVLAYFRVGKTSNPIEVSRNEFVGSGGDRVSTQKAYLFTSFHKPEDLKASPISRAAIEDITGISPRQQRRYDSKASTIKHNYAITENHDTGKAPCLTCYKHKTRQWIVPRQIPNSYNCKAFRAPRGMLWKMRNITWRSLHRDGARPVKRFFNTPDALIHYTNRSLISFFPSISQPAYELWEMVVQP